MRCPFCQSPLHSSAPECPSCQLSFPKARTLLGAVPRLSPMVADTTRRLGISDHAKLKRRISEIQTRFPEVVLQIAMHEFPEEHPLALHVFWLFNAANFAGDSRRGSNNHSLLVVLDPRRRESAVMPGYALEPYLGDEAIGHLLDLAAPAWEAGRWADGFLRVLDGLDPWLESFALPEQSISSTTGEF